MANKLLLCISANQATAARWRSGRLTDCAVFDNSEAGVAEFRDYAATSGNAPAFVIVDAVEEDYRIETLPHATGSDRAQMIDRKLRQYYRGSPYSAASLIGRDSSKRRDDRFLFSALTNAEMVDPWLAVLTECGLPVGGVYLLPMVTAGLVEALGEKASNLLLVAVQPVGIRLTFFRANAFRLSRLSRSDTDTSARDKAVIDEISNTRLYLHALRAATLDEPVSVVLLDHADELGETTRAIREANLQCTHVGRAALASLLKIDPELLALSPSVLYLQLLGARVPSNNLAPVRVTAGYQRYQTRRQLFIASAAVAVIGIAWSGYNLGDRYALQNRTEDVTRQTARVNADYQQATLQFPSAPTSAENLRKATELADRLRTTEVRPQGFLEVVMRALESSPDITLTELGWQYRKGEFETGTVAAGAANPAPASGAPGGDLRKQSGLITGQVQDFRGDFRKAIASINMLAEHLRKDPAVEDVRVVQLPLDVSPKIALTGSTTDVPSQANTAEFKLVIVLKQPT